MTDTQKPTVVVPKKKKPTKPENYAFWLSMLRSEKFNKQFQERGTKEQKENLKRAKQYATFMRTNLQPVTEKITPPKSEEKNEKNTITC